MRLHTDFAAIAHCIVDQVLALDIEHLVLMVMHVSCRKDSHGETLEKLDIVARVQAATTSPHNELLSPLALVSTPWLAVARRPTTFSATDTPVNSYWRDQGLTHHYHTFAVMLQSNYVSPHQVLLDTDIDHFSHHEAGPALMVAADKFPEDPPSDADESA